MRRFVTFWVLEAKSCVFPLAILLGIGLSKWVEIPGIARYDLLLCWSLLVQIAMVRLGLESLKELWATGAFHLLGLALELHRTALGAWSYPDAGLFRIGAVPIFSGFMYAGIGSYVMQAWRRFGLTYSRLPNPWLAGGLATLGYLSFFVWALERWLILGLIVLCFARTQVHFTVDRRRFRMPLALSFGLIGGFIWLGENAATFFGAWRYANQRHGWTWVEGGKLTAWYLLVVVAFMLVERFRAWAQIGSTPTRAHIS